MTSHVIPHTPLLGRHSTDREVLEGRLIPEGMDQYDHQVAGLPARFRARTAAQTRRRLEYESGLHDRFRDPQGPGYGRSMEWPFDTTRALYDDFYRTGVWRAYRSGWTAPNWRAATSRLLDAVWRRRATFRRIHALEVAAGDEPAPFDLWLRALVQLPRSRAQAEPDWLSAHDEYPEPVFDPYAGTRAL